MRNTRALLMLLLALVLAGAAVLTAAIWMGGQSTPSNQKIVVALVDIGVGTKITPLMLRSMDWPAGAQPPGAFADSKALDGRITRTAISLGEPVLESKLAPPGTSGGLSSIVADGKRAMTVRVNDVVGVAGFALPGNFVDILVNTQGEGARKTPDRDPNISKIVLERILVLAIAQESSRDDTKPKVVNAVTLELTPDQAEKLDLARSVGTLSLVLRTQVDPQPGVTTGATKLTLLGGPHEADPAPAAVPVLAVAPRPVRVAKAAPEAARQCSGVIDGTRQSRECF